MAHLKTLKALDGSKGETTSGTGELILYSAHWNEILILAAQEARRQSSATPCDVRIAGYALDLLGIPNQHSEAELDESGRWIVYWR